LSLAAAGAARADFDLVGSIPAPVGDCPLSVVTGLASDGENLLVTTSSMGSTRVFLVSPATGEVLKRDRLTAGMIPCPGYCPLVVSAAYDADGGRYWVGDLEGRFTAFRWVADDEIEVETCIGPVAFLHGGIEWAGDDALYALDALFRRLVVLGMSGEELASYALPEMGVPTALTSEGGNLFAATMLDGVIYEMTGQADLVQVHELMGGAGGLCGSMLYAAAFHDGLLYLSGLGDSIGIFAPAGGIVIPEGDSVAVGVPGELEFTFESVVDSGMLYVHEAEEDPCPAPPGVHLFPEFYEVGADAEFDFVVEVAVIDSVLPPGVAPERVRVFTRPSGPCGTWRDATVDYVEDIETLKIQRRTRSEDDEFSWFAIGEDTRPPAEIVALKFGRLRGHVESGADSIPPDALALIRAALDAAESAYCKGWPEAARARLADLRAVVRNTPAIPHTYFSDHPGANLAGRIISRARTLAFSLRYSHDQALATTALVEPGTVRVGVPGLLTSAVLEVPEGLDPYAVEPDCIYMEGLARCLPGSLSVADHDDDGDLEIRAVFRQGDFEEAFDETGPATVRLTCFVGGYEVHATAEVEVVMPEVQLLSEEVEGGETYRVSWEGFNCKSIHPYALSFSPDGGMTWDLVDGFIEEQSYDWTAPYVSTDEALLRVTCVDRDGAEHSAGSGFFVITAAAGVDDVPAAGFRLALSPNPAAARVAVEFASPRPQQVTLAVYSVKGKLVRTLFRGRMDAGVAHAEWLGDNQAGRRVSPGTYFIVLRGETRTLTEKVVVQR